MTAGGEGRVTVPQECVNWQVTHVLVDDLVLMLVRSALIELSRFRKRGSKKEEEEIEVVGRVMCWRGWGK